LPITAPYNSTPIEVFAGECNGKLCAVAHNNRTLANANLNGVRYPAFVWTLPDSEDIKRLNAGPTDFSNGTLPSKTIAVTANQKSKVVLKNYGVAGYISSNASISVER